MMPFQDNWHLDKRFPIALIITILIQSGGLVFWGGHKFGTIESRLQQIEAQKATDARLSIAETQIDTNRELVRELQRQNEAQFRQIYEALIRLEKKMDSR